MEGLRREQSRGNVFSWGCFLPEQAKALVPAGTAPTDSCLGAKPLPHGKLPAVPAPVTLATGFFRLCK